MTKRITPGVVLVFANYVARQVACLMDRPILGIDMDAAGAILCRGTLLIAMILVPATAVLSQRGARRASQPDRWGFPLALASATAISLQLLLTAH